MKSIKIDGSDNEILSVTLNDVLYCLEEGEKKKWGLLWLDAVVVSGEKGSLIEKDSEINKSKTAWIISWKELIKLSSQIYQSINLLIIGDNYISNIKKYSTDENMYENCGYTIELIDSSYWIIHSDDENFIKICFEKLDGVAEL